MCKHVAQSIDLYNEFVAYLHRREKMNDDETASSRSKLIELCE